jgi:hypothetical protein
MYCGPVARRTSLGAGEHTTPDSRLGLFCQFVVVSRDGEEHGLRRRVAHAPAEPWLPRATAHADCSRGDGGQPEQKTQGSSKMVGPFILLFHDDEYDLGYVAHAISARAFPSLRATTMLAISRRS